LAACCTDAVFRFPQQFLLIWYCMCTLRPKQWRLAYFIGYMLHTCSLQIPTAIPAHMVLYVSSETEAKEPGLLFWLHAAHMLSSDSLCNSCSYGTVCVLCDQSKEAWLTLLAACCTDAVFRFPQQFLLIWYCMCPLRPKQRSLAYFIGYMLHTCCLQIPSAIPAHMVLYVSSETKAKELGLLFWLHAAHMLSSDSLSNSCSYRTGCVL
jgi:hypothetical protein